MATLGTTGSTCRGGRGARGTPRTAGGAATHCSAARPETCRWGSPASCERRRVHPGGVACPAPQSDTGRRWLRRRAAREATPALLWRQRHGPGAVAVGGVVVPHLRFLSTLARSAGNGSAPATWQAPCEAPRSPRAVTPMAVTVTTVGPMPCRTLFPRLRTSRTVSGRRSIAQVCCRYGRPSGWAAATSVRSRGGAAAPGDCHLPRVSRAAQHQAANGEPSLGPASEEQGRVPARPPAHPRGEQPAHPRRGKHSRTEAVLEASPWG